MDQAQKDNAAQLAEMIIANGQPDKNSSTRLLRLSGRSIGASSPRFIALLDELTAKVTKSTNQVDIDNHRKCLNIILNTLTLCIFRFEWVSLPTNEPNFIKGEYLHWLGFSRRIMQRCVDVLLKNGVMIFGRKGFKAGNTYGTRPKASQYYSTPTFIQDMCESLYMEYGNFDANKDDDLYRFKRFLPEDIPDYQTYQYKIDIIRRYNAFMRDHSWAMKNPNHISVKDFDGRSGRVTNYYQNIAQRRVPIRTNTLLDGEKIAEPDFSANHLRMASYLVGEELPADPYTIIGDETGLTREQIKSVVTKCMGASSKAPKGYLIATAHLAKVPLHADGFRAALSSLEHHYSWTKDIFFNDMGTRLQYLEGEIGLQMMDWAVNEQIPLLAVHDAFAVRECDEEATYHQMKAYWNQVVMMADLDEFLKNTEYTVPLVIGRKKTI
ncbi:MAG: hypothetical protein ACKE9I_04365 [Methylophagaceae bacterium]